MPHHPLSFPIRRSVLHLLIPLVLPAIAILWAGSLAQAQSSLQVQNDAVELDFPNKITFKLVASASESVSEVYLEYGTSGRSCVEGVARQEAKMTDGDPFNASWEWDFKDSGSLPPGVEIWWQWEVHTLSGAVLTTQKKSQVIEDPHLKWKKLESDQVQVVWSEGSQSFAQRILDLAISSLDRLGKEAGIHPDGKIRLTVYPSFETLRSAVLFMPEWTGGIAFPEDSVVMLGIPVDSGKWMEQVVPHELAHLITGQRVFNCLGNRMPTWLSEGLSVYSEAAVSPEDGILVQAALEKDALPPLHNLAAGFSADEDQARLSYAQSGEIVRFLIKEKGPDKLAELLDAIQSGLLIDPALQQVYGFDTDGLDSAWRVSLGFEGIQGEAGTVTPTAARTAVPTRPLWTPAFGRASPTLTLAGPATATPVELAQAATVTSSSCEGSQTCMPGVETSTSAPSAPVPTSTSPSTKAPSTRPCLGGAIVLVGLLFALAVRKSVI